MWRCQSDSPGPSAKDEEHARADRCPDNQLPTAPSFPKVANELGCAGTRFQGPARAFNVQEATTYSEHLEQSSQLPFPLDGGEEILPQDVKDAASFLVNNSSSDVWRSGRAGQRS